MFKHIYRGYEYDSDRRLAELRSQGEGHVDFVYRGVHHDGSKAQRQDRDTMAKTDGAMWYRGYRSA